MNDEISGIFDDLTPEDFNMDTSAIDESTRTAKGVEAFNAFVTEQLRSVRLAYAAADGVINPIAILASPVKQRVFSPEDDETMGDYVRRLNREAIAMAATWVFISRKTLVGTYKTTPDELPDVTDPDAVQRAIATGILAEGLVWFSERREGDERHRRHGVIPEVSSGRLGEPAEGDEAQMIPLFDSILNRSE